MTAFADAMIFMVVMMMAISVTAACNHAEHGADIGPDNFLRDISSIELRLSDLTGIDDDSLVFLSDLLALSLAQETDVCRYLESILDAVFGENRYFLSFEYEGMHGAVGTEFDRYSSQDSRTIPVSIGGSIHIMLCIL